MADESSPAAVAEAPQVTAEAPVAAEAAPAPEAATTEAPKAKPDIKSLLDDPDFKKDYEHRVASEAGRRAKAEREAWERQQAELKQAEEQKAFRQRVAQLVERYSDDPDAAAVKSALDVDDFKAKQSEWQQQVVEGTVKQAGMAWKAALLAELADDDALTDEDRAFLDPYNVERFKSNAAFVKEWRKRAADNSLKKELDKVLPVEREALRQQVLAELRGESQTPASLPQGAAVTDDQQFLREYGEGRSNDRARAARLLGINL